MAKIALEKYVDTCVERLNAKVSENVIIEHINNLVECGGYNDLKTRVVWDVCRFTCKSFEILSEDDYNTATDKKITSLYCNAFERVFPTAWRLIKEKG